MRLRQLLSAALLVVGAVLAGSPAAAAPVPVPVTAMLQPADLGSGWTVSAEEVMGDWNFGYTLTQCSTPLWSTPDYVAMRGRQFSLGSGGAYVPQEVRRYGSDLHARLVLMAAVRNASVCPEIVKVDRGNGQIYGTMRLAIVAEDFAGDGSVLLRESYTSAAGTSVGLRVFVRKGAHVTEFRPVGDVPEARRLAVAAAARM